MDQVAIAKLSKVFQDEDGSHTTAERTLADQVSAVAPHIPFVSRVIHDMRQRMVRRLLAAGIRQFVDLASGVPVDGHVHHALRETPNARVVYVDLAEVIVDEGRRIVAGCPQAVVVQGDILDRDAVLADPEVRKAIDLRAPVAVLLIDTLQFFPKEQAADVVAQWADVICAGSYVGVTQYGDDPTVTAGLGMFGKLFGVLPPYIRFGEAADLRNFLAAAHLDLVAPGCVRVPDWHPDTPHTATSPNSDRFPAFAALAAKA